MESLNGVIGTCTIIFLAVRSYAVINCPDIYITIEGSRAIFCQSSRNIMDFYWYRGTRISESSILWLESGKKGGTEYGGEHFDIFENGSMVMKNVTIEHESYYTFVGYYNIVDFENATFLVTVTMSPDPNCPVITYCNPCEHCVIDNPKEADTLTCHIIGARPSIPLTWNITSQSGISFVQREAKQQRNNDKVSWDTYLSLDYTVFEPCGAIANVQCVGKDKAGIASTNIASLQINNGLCNGTTPPTEGGLGLAQLLPPLIIVPVVVILFMILIGRYLYKKKERRLKKDRHRDTDDPFMPLVATKVTKGDLVRNLARFYERFCSLKPLPWGEPIPISALYSDFQCKVTAIVSAREGNRESKDIEKITSSEDLFASSNFLNASRVLFIADLGYGKTTMTQEVVQQWIKEGTERFILIYLQMKDVDVNKSIALAVKDMLPDSTNADTKDIEKVLKQNKVLVLLDGLDELEMSVDNGVFEEVVNDEGCEMINESKCDTSDSKSVVNDITIADLLKDKVKNINSKMRVWVTSREVDDMKAPFPPPYVKVKLTGFSDNQIDSYLRKTCEYYCDPVHDSKADTIKATIESVLKNVKDIIEKDDIIQEFVKTPLLLVLIIHILTGKVTGKIAYLKDMQLTKLTTLIRTVITCLESRYVQKIKDKSIDCKIQEIERKLGEIGWKQKLEVANYDREGWDKMLGTEYVNIALSIGLLRLSKQISNSNVQMRNLAFSSFTGVVFYHQFFLEYLAGQYFSTDEHALKQLEKSLKDTSDDRTIRFLQFMSGSGHPFAEKVSKIILKDQKMWNNFADFIHETEDEEKVKAYLEELSKKAEKLGKPPVVNFQYLDKKHHQDAVLAFCESCNKYKIEIRALTFRPDCPLTYLTKLALPQLKRLELLEWHITGKDIVSILEWISHQKLPQTFQFTKCTFKDELSDENKEKIKTAMNGKELNIYRNKTKSQTGISVESFNVEKGVWTKKYFPKKQ